ncbi:MAG: glycosyltransferase [Desertimonas sp.]
MTRRVADDTAQLPRHRVLFVHTPHLPPLGADTWVHSQIIRHLDRTRTSVHLAAVFHPDASPTAMAVADVADINRLDVDLGREDPSWATKRSWSSVMSTLTAPRGLFRLVRYVRRHDIDLVTTSDRPRDAVAAWITARLTGAQLLVHVHTDYAPWMSRPLRLVLRRADRLIGVSEYVTRTLETSGHERVTTVLNAIDVDAWQPGHGRTAARAELGIADDEVLVLSVCRLYPGKGVGDLLDACCTLLGEHPKVRLAIAGEDVTRGRAYRTQLAETVTRRGADHAVQLLGHRDDVRRLMAAADIFAMPAHGEPFGLVYVEAMAMELPVVSLSTGGTVEVVEHGVTGLLSERDDLAGLTAHLAELVTDPERRRAMGRAGRRRADQRFRLERQARDVEAVYDQMLAPRERGEPITDHANGGPMGVVTVNDPPPTDIEGCRQVFDERGYLVFRDVVDRSRLATLADELSGEYQRVVERGEMFKGGGTVSGHLNCFPGAGSRFVWDDLAARGIPDLVRALRPDIADRRRVTLNFNLPGSVAQHYHSDGLYVEEFLICNIAVVDTDLENGALDVLPGTHQRFYRFWEYATQRKYRLTTRLPVRAGDVILRRSTMWHRGMPNLTTRPRPMMAITFGETAAPPSDPWNEFDGRANFTPNWYSTSRLGQWRERVFVKAPATYAAYRFVKSLRGNRGYSHW